MVKGRALISRTKFQSESKMKCSLKSVKGEKENRDLNNVKLIQVLMSRLFTFLDLFWALPKNLYAFIALWLHYLLIRFFVSRVRWLSSVSSLRPPSKVMFCCLAITDLCVGLIFKRIFAVELLLQMSEQQHLLDMKSIFAVMNTT